MQTTEIVKALRLCVGVARGPCEDCPASDCDREVSCTTAAMIGAADRLETLLNRCARCAEEIAVLRERQRWIPVTEQLPADGERVLAYGKDRVIHDAKWSWPQSAWFDKVTGDEYFEGFVTHWMPMPPAPEVE